MKQSIQVILFALFIGLGAAAAWGQGAAMPDGPMYTFTVKQGGAPAAYDEALAVACLQGLINRGRPVLYVVSENDPNPKYWWEKLSAEGRWLHGRQLQPVGTVDELVRLAGERLKGAVIWDPDVAATVNVATTIAGAEDLVVLSPEMAEQCLARWGVPARHNLRGMFDGHETGSRKNDAYRWAVREYLAKGKCSSHFLCLYEDSFFARSTGDLRYVAPRDWPVKNRAFVFDLSPWGDETPGDDPGQPLGTDLATYRMVLTETRKQARGRHMTEVGGSNVNSKYADLTRLIPQFDPIIFCVEGTKTDLKDSASWRQPILHDSTPTEWENVRLISGYSAYQNKMATHCYNQSFHAWAPFTPLKQHRPVNTPPLERKTYICVVMTDFDSVMPLYRKLPPLWDDPVRGTVPIAWGINPNLIETYPDIVTYLYATATDNDYFVSGSSGAGYFNPNYIPPRQLGLFVRHNRHFFGLTDMSIAARVVDWRYPTPRVKDAYTQFAPDGYGAHLHDFRWAGLMSIGPHVWKGMPVAGLFNDTFVFLSPQDNARVMHDGLRSRGMTLPGFGMYRFLYAPPGLVAETLEIFRKEHPELHIEFVDPYTFFRLFREWRMGLPE